MSRGCFGRRGNFGRSEEFAEEGSVEILSRLSSRVLSESVIFMRKMSGIGYIEEILAGLWENSGVQWKREGMIAYLDRSII